MRGTKKRARRKTVEECEVIATIVLRGIGGNEPKSFAQRKAVALWLRRQARSLIMNGNEYSKRFTARHYWPLDGWRKL